MIEVTVISLIRPQRQTFIVKNKKKIEYWKKREGVGMTIEVKIIELEGGEKTNEL